MARDHAFIMAKKEEEKVTMAENERVVNEIKKAINDRTQEEEVGAKRSINI